MLPRSSGGLCFDHLVNGICSRPYHLINFFAVGNKPIIHIFSEFIGLWVCLRFDIAPQLLLIEYGLNSNYWDVVVTPGRHLRGKKPCQEWFHKVGPYGLVLTLAISIPGPIACPQLHSHSLI